MSVSALHREAFYALACHDRIQGLADIRPALPLLTARDRANEFADILPAIDFGDPLTILAVEIIAAGRRAEEWLAALLDDIAGHAPPCIGNATVCADGEAWRPVSGGERGIDAIVLPIWRRAGGIIGVADVIALDKANPARWRSLTRAVDILGDVDEALAHGPLRVRQHPLDWLNSGGMLARSVCFLDDEVAAVELLMAREIIADNPRHAAHLERLVHTLRGPTIRYAAPAARRAA